VLQHALNTPDLNTAEQVTTRQAPVPATYGTLIRSARAALDDAISMSNGRPPRGDAALQGLLGYERFLYGAGGHLRQLTTLADLHTDALRRLTNRLENSSQPGARESTWLRAATMINTAHDLVATHLIDGTPRTAEAEELILGPAVAAASREVISMLLDAVAGSRQMMHRVARAQQRGHGASPIPGPMFAHIHATNRVVSLCAKATMHDLAALPVSTHSTFHDLKPALPSDLTVSPAPISSPLAALRVLRQLCHDQARGLTAASPASLRDVALLGARVSTAAVLPAIDDHQPLPRLQRAHAEDQLDAARTAWTQATAELTTVVRGLNKAPGAYRAAVRTLLDEPLDQRTQRALLTALPTLGRDAARTVQTLAVRGELVTRQPIPLQPRTAWRAIGDEQATLLTERFATAALTSARALAAVRDLHPTPPPPQHSARSEPARQRHLSQTLDQRGASR